MVESHGIADLHLRISSVQFSRSVVSDSLRPHESQHARPPCPSPTPGVYSTHVHQVGDAIKAFLSLLAILWNTEFNCLYLSFSIWLSPLFSQLFIRPPQTAILLCSFLFLGHAFDHSLMYSVTNLHQYFFSHSVYQI